MQTIIDPSAAAGIVFFPDLVAASENFASARCQTVVRTKQMPAKEAGPIAPNQLKQVCSQQSKCDFPHSLWSHQ
ncbi:MAG TPA: hypothetical protein VMU31_01100 [Rhizomicrobium sp.]|nr:hypothetical protein [Rhizomicrobium sp.]